MKKKQTNLTCVMIVQQLNKKYWIEWDKDIISEAKKGNIEPLLKEVVNRFSNGGCTVAEAYGIIHNKDTITIWNQEYMKNIEEKKATHVHLLIKFNKGASLDNLASMVGLEPQYLEKAKSGRYGYDNLLSYLVHAKDKSKFQYKPDDVFTLLGENYTSLYNRKMETWARGRATKEVKETNLSVDFLISEILSGHINKSQILLTDKYYKVYAHHKRKINDALETRGENKSYQAISALEKGEFKKSIIFITANSGKGKTVFSKKLIDILQSTAKKYTNNSWEYCLTASTNAFDEYNGQDILFLDDIRGDSLTVSDWLKLLDPFTISPISARYHNKMGAAKVIIITSTKQPAEFFKIAKGNYDEDLGQFFRRIDYLINIQNDYILSTPIKNPNFSDEIDYPPFMPYPNSYVFSKINDKKDDKNTALNKMVKTMISNMNWTDKNIENLELKIKQAKIN